MIWTTTELEILFSVLGLEWEIRQYILGRYHVGRVTTNLNTLICSLDIDVLGEYLARRSQLFIMTSSDPGLAPASSFFLLVPPTR